MIDTKVYRSSIARIQFPHEEMRNYFYGRSMCCHCCSSAKKVSVNIQRLGEIKLSDSVSGFDDNSSKALLPS